MTESLQIELGMTKERLKLMDQEFSNKLVEMQLLRDENREIRESRRDEDEKIDYIMNMIQSIQLTDRSDQVILSQRLNQNKNAKLELIEKDVTEKIEQIQTLNQLIAQLK